MTEMSYMFDNGCPFEQSLRQMVRQGSLINTTSSGSSFSNEHQRSKIIADHPDSASQVTLNMHRNLGSSYDESSSINSETMGNSERLMKIMKCFLALQLSLIYGTTINTIA